MNCKVLDMSKQHISCELNHVMVPQKFIITYVFAKCKDYLKRSLWDKMLAQADTSYPWCNVGDFNMLSSLEEKLRGITYNINKSFEFISVIEYVISWILVLRGRNILSLI